MTGWNYRLCKITYQPGTEWEEVSYEIREAYYNEDGSIWAITDTVVGVYGASVEETQKCIERMNLAYNKEVIDLDTFVFAPRNDNDDLDEDEIAKIDQEDFGEISKDLDKE